MLRSPNVIATQPDQLSQVRNALERIGVQAFWVAKPANIRYLTGFTSPADAKLLVTLDTAILYTDGRYTVQAEEESRVPFHIARGQEVLDHARTVVTGLELAFEADAVTYAQFDELKETLQVTLRAVKDVIEPLRAIKTPDELERIRRAARITDDALAATLPKVMPGAQERDIALELEFAMRRLGAEKAGFEITVASGPRGAMPHGGASGRTIGEGELVTIDMGAVVDGYHADLTRTVAVGEPDRTLRAVYRVVLEAQRQAIEAMRPGASCFGVDKVARDHIASVGLGDYFVHGLGHGVGLAIHEGPNLSYRTPEGVPLETGAVVTVEPGVYLPGQGGVRIEDLVLVTESGVEVLSHAPKAEL